MRIAPNKHFCELAFSNQATRSAGARACCLFAVRHRRGASQARHRRRSQVRQRACTAIATLCVCLRSLCTFQHVTTSSANHRILSHLHLHHRSLSLSLSFVCAGMGMPPMMRPPPMGMVGMPPPPHAMLVPPPTLFPPRPVLAQPPPPGVAPSVPLGPPGVTPPAGPPGVAPATTIAATTSSSATTSTSSSATPATGTKDAKDATASAGKDAGPTHVFVGKLPTDLHDSSIRQLLEVRLVHPSTHRPLPFWSSSSLRLVLLTRPNDDV